MNLGPTIKDYKGEFTEDEIKKHESINLSNQLERCRKYCSEADGSVKNIAFKICWGVGTGAFVGAFIGGTTGLLMTSYSGPTALFGWKAGSLGGAAIGSIVGGVPITIIQTQHSSHYRQWKSKDIKERVSEVFVNYIKEDEILKDFCCPILLDLPSFPMRAPDNLVYDHFAILNWIEQKGQNVASIIRKCDFTAEDLIFDDGRFWEISKRIHNLLCIELEKFKNSTIEKEAEKNFKESISELEKIFNHLTMEALKKLKDATIEPDEFSTLIIEAEKNFKESILEAEKIKHSKFVGATVIRDGLFAYLEERKDICSQIVISIESDSLKKWKDLTKKAKEKGESLKYTYEDHKNVVERAHKTFYEIFEGSMKVNF